MHFARLQKLWPREQVEEIYRLKPNSLIADALSMLLPFKLRITIRQGWPRVG